MAEDYIPLKIMAPLSAADHAASTAKPTSTNRYYKAYPGLLYEVQIAVHGGVFPFVYALDSGPTGMTVDSVSGVLSWPNPLEAGSPHSVTVSVVDSDAVSDSVTWTITVTTDGFIFMDGVNGTLRGSGGTGTKNNPYKVLKDWYCADVACTSAESAAALDDNTHQGEFLYWRTGTYNSNTLPRHIQGGGGYNDYVSFSGGTKPLVWLAYPGDSPVLDLTGAMLNFWGSSDNLYVDGIEFKDMEMAQAFSVASNMINVLFRKNYFHDRCNGCGGGSSNAAPIFINRNGPGRNHVVVDNHFADTYDAAYHAILAYASEGLVFERNLLDGDSLDATGIGVKQDNQNWSIRNNRILLPDCTRGIWVSSGSPPDEIQHNIEMTYNLVKCALGDALKVGDSALEFTNFLSKRNTWVTPDTYGGVIVGWLTTSTKGPMRFVNDVISHPTGEHEGLFSGVACRYSLPDVNDPTCNTQPSNLITIDILNSTDYGDGIVDGDGNLTGTFRTQFLGTHGYELGDGPEGDSTVPAPPANLVVN